MICTQNIVHLDETGASGQSGAFFFGFETTSIKDAQTNISLAQGKICSSAETNSSQRLEVVLWTLVPLFLSSKTNHCWVIVLAQLNVQRFKNKSKSFVLGRCKSLFMLEEKRFIPKKQVLFSSSFLCLIIFSWCSSASWPSISCCYLFVSGTWAR